MTNFTMRTGINLMESVLVETTVDKLHEFLNSNIGELVGYTFREAQTPGQLTRAIQATATDMYNDIKFNQDWQTAKDHGITNLKDLTAFMDFAKQVALNPQDYFDAYHAQLSEALEQTDLENELPYLNGDDKEEVQNEIIDLELQKRQ